MKKGFSLIEIILSLTIILLLSFGGFWIKKILSDNTSNSDLIKNINIISNNLKSITISNNISSSNDISFYDYLVSKLYKRDSEKKYYYDDKNNTFFNFKVKNNIIVMQILIKKDSCLKFSQDILSTSQYAIKINPITDLSSLYIPSNSTTPEYVLKNQNVSENYNLNDILLKCNQKINSNLPLTLGLVDSIEKYSEVDVFLY